jgi:predicted outer membrane repeat protein
MHSQNHRLYRSALRNRSLSKANVDSVVRKLVFRRANKPILAEMLERRVMLSGGPFTVSNLSDSGTGSLRQAITSAESAGGSQTINFASGLTGTIALGSALPGLTGNLTIDGPGASVITVKGVENSTVFTIGSGQTVLLENLTVTGGSSFSLDGGGVANNGGNVTLQADVITGNVAQYGGGVFNSGTLTITGTTISDNNANGFLAMSGGGGIDNQGALTIVNSTISGNTCGNFGGAILSTTAMSLTDSTVYGNVSLYYSNQTGGTSQYTPGGIDAEKSCTLNGTIVAGNTYDIYGGPFIGSHDLIGDSGAVPSGSLTLTSSIIGTSISPVTADMDPLGNYGGPTPTQALMADSPAIGQGAVFAAANGVDQRGFVRTPGFIDIGAFQSADAPEPTLTVTNLNDSGTGSLRQAITTANLDYGLQTIVFTPSLTGTISLASALPGLIANTTIAGPGAGVLSVNGNSHGSVFTVSPGGNAQIENLTITGGSASFGGDINNQSSLTVANCVITGGHAEYGGGIDNQGLLTLTNSTITANSASVHGGGIFSTSGTVTVSNSTLSGNSSFAGGAIATTLTSVNVSSSTLSGNTATFAGGGIYGDALYASISVVNCTLTGNSAGIKGGAIFNTGKFLQVVDSTISGNSAGSGGGIQGGGKLYGDIVATNSGGDLAGTLSGNHSLIGDGSNSASFSNSLTGTTALPLNPLLGPLASNGGPTQTEALLPGSPAIGASAPFVQANNVDQRGQPRPGPFGTDIGAFQTGLIVNTLGDPSTVTAGTLSLRQAIADANSFGGTRTITFAPSLSGTIHLTSQLPAISTNLVLDGPGASVITVNGGNHSNVFTIKNGEQVLIENLTITGGSATSGSDGDGGGILNNGTLTILDCVIIGNTAGSGGGIESGGLLTITNSTLSGNVAAGLGGGIYSFASLYISGSTISGNSAPYGAGVANQDHQTTVTSSTFSGNSASRDGGGFFGSGEITATNSTFSANSAKSSGGAIFGESQFILTDCTISGNTAAKSSGGGIYTNAGTGTTQLIDGTIIAANTGGDISGFATFTGSHNLIGDGSDATSFTSSLSGTMAIPLNPMLSPLGNFGGPTLTMAELTGSPGLGKGADFNNLTTDQRGFPRPTVSGIDIGADQGALFPGDTNFDGTVNLTDLLTLLNNYGETGKGWTQGDFNFDGTVNLTDLLALLNNYGESANDNSIAAPAAAVVSYKAASSPFSSEPLTLNSSTTDVDGEILQPDASVL